MVRGGGRGVLSQETGGLITTPGSFLPAASRSHFTSGINYPEQFVLAANPHVTVNTNITHARKGAALPYSTVAL